MSEAKNVIDLAVLIAALQDKENKEKEHFYASMGVDVNRFDEVMTPVCKILEKETHRCIDDGEDSINKSVMWEKVFIYMGEANLSDGEKFATIMFLSEEYDALLGKIATRYMMKKDPSQVLKGFAEMLSSKL